jgi:hypothetical protein
MADSAALRDSLRLDSLKRAHELRQLRQRRPRGKKPAGG